MSAYLDQEPRTLDRVAAALDVQIRALREAIAHHHRMIRVHQDHLGELENRRDTIADAMQARDEARWRESQCRD